MGLNKIPSFQEVKDWANSSFNYFDSNDAINAVDNSNVSVGYADNAGDADQLGGQGPSHYETNIPNSTDSTSVSGGWKSVSISSGRSGDADSYGENTLNGTWYFDDPNYGAIASADKIDFEITVSCSSQDGTANGDVTVYGGSGQIGSFYSTVNNGNSNTQTFSANIPSQMNLENISTDYSLTIESSDGGRTDGSLNMEITNIHYESISSHYHTI